MTFKDAWDIFQKSLDAAHKLWAYFMTISLAVAGYVVGWDKIDWSSKMYFAVALGYFIFAMGNRKVLRAAQGEVVGASALVRQVQDSLAKDAPERKLQLSAVEEDQVSRFHYACTALVVLAIGVTWWDKCVEHSCPKPSTSSSAAAPTAQSSSSASAPR
jgi:hypothetical protein